MEVKVRYDKLNDMVPQINIVKDKPKRTGLCQQLLCKRLVVLVTYCNEVGISPSAT